MITTDPHNFIVNKIKVRGEDSKNPGEEYLSPLKYSHTIEGALKMLKGLMGKEIDSTTIDGYLAEVEKLNGRFEKILQGEKQ